MVRLMEWINIRDKWPDDEKEILVCTISKKGVRNVDKRGTRWETESYTEGRRK